MLFVALALALAPVAAIILFFYSRDKYDPEPRWLLARAFAYGIASVVPAFMGSAFGSYLGFDISPNIWTTFIYAFFVVGLSEELAKFVFLRFGLFPQADFNEPYDGILYSVMVSMGFAAFENIVYVAEGGVALAIVRMFTAVPAHATFGAIMGYYAGMAKFTPHQRNKLLFQGLALAIFMHGLYDFFLMQQLIEGMVLGAIGSLIISVIYTMKAIKMHQQASPFRNENKQLIRIQAQTENLAEFETTTRNDSPTIQNAYAADPINTNSLPDPYSLSKGEDETQLFAKQEPTAKKLFDDIDAILNEDMPMYIPPNLITPKEDNNS